MLKFIPAIVLLVLAVLCWLASTGNKSGAAMSSGFMIVPAAIFGALALIAGLIAWFL